MTDAHVAMVELACCIRSTRFGRWWCGKQGHHHSGLKPNRRSRLWEHNPMKDDEHAEAVRAAARTLGSAAEKAALAGLLVNIEIQRLEVAEFEDKHRRHHLVITASISRPL